MTAKGVEIKDLAKSFGTLKAVDGISFNINQGEIFGLLGPNGAGKTTTIQMLCGLLAPDAGEIVIHGQPVTAGAFAVMRKVGVCTQNNILWEKLTCLEQLVFLGQMYQLGQKRAHRRATLLLDQLGLGEKKDTLAQHLSGGMKRRLNLALAMVHDPELVILDEPEAGLDPQSRLLVRDYIRSLAPEKTVILTTHNMDEAERLSDRVAIIDHGALLVVDTPQALKRTVGDGDVIEIELLRSLASSVTADLEAMGLKVQTADHSLLLRGSAIVASLPAILDVLQKTDTQIGEMRMRANSLEDVFIAMTGRQLRE